MHRTQCKVGKGQVKRESFVRERANALRLIRLNERKRSKLWGSDTANDAGWVTGGDRVGGDIICEAVDERLIKRISLSGYSKRLA
jgi:hypothetical protein